jgi:Viral BACON domain
VASVGDNVFVVADDGSGYFVGGTSCAAPSWAAFTALANQQAAAAGYPSIGFINPTIYPIGKSANYLSDFHDIVTGNNFWGSSTNKFPAVPGYDLCTGWGTPGGDNLIDALAAVSDSLAVAPGQGFVSFGAPGGPFTANTVNFSLTNSGTSSLKWSLINTSSWLTASVANHTLTPGSPAANVAVSLNAAADTLSPGTYTAGVLFSNQTTHTTRTREFTLLVGQPLIQNGNFDDAVLSGWAQSGGVYQVASRHHTTSYPVYNWEFVDSNGLDSGISPHSGTYFEVNSCPENVGYLTQAVPTIPGQSYLLSFWFTSLAAGTTQQFIVNWNTNSTTTNTILNLLNPPAFGWTYTNFVLAAAGTNTLLQFGGRNDTSWFGLQDINLVAIPLPNIRLIPQVANNALLLTWNSQTNLAYEVQGSTNVASSNWLNLSTNVATGPILTATNPIGSYPAMFYRVLLLP